MLVSAVPMLLLCVLAVDRGAAAEIPPPFKQLIAQGNVEFEFYDSRAERRRYPGMALFLLYVDHHYRFRYDVTQHDGSLHLKIRPVMRKVECRISHKIRLPERFDSDDRWSHWLVAHEFDHVAISTDPRPIMLIEHLLKKLRPIRRTVELNEWGKPGETVDAQYVGRIVEEQVVKRRKAVERLVQANYDLLDEITRHGVRPIPDREAFFESLYTKANLEQMRFPYAAEVSSLLSSRTYQNVERPH